MLRRGMGLAIICSIQICAQAHGDTHQSLSFNQSDLDACRRDSVCEGGDGYKKAEAMHAADTYEHQSDALEMAQTLAADENRFAEVAAEKGCKAVARRMFLGVIETYVGSAFQAMRQRAMIGIEDLRASKP